MKKRKLQSGGNIGSILQGISPLLSLIPGIGTGAGIAAGTLGSLLSALPEKNKVIAASPSNLQSGGPLMPQDNTSMQVNLNPLRRLVPDISATNLFASRDSFPETGKLMSQYFEDMNKGQDLLGHHAASTSMSSKRMSKVDFRAHERAHGGKLNMANGGDIATSSASFKVQGDPSQIDSESYTMGNQDVNLDHNELVKEGQDGAYVFSNRLNPEGSKKTFADLAAKNESRIKRAERKLRFNPDDTIAANTVEYTNKQQADLAVKQELHAAAKGLRETGADMRTGTVPSSYQSGGPIQRPRNNNYGFMDPLFNYNNQGPIPPFEEPLGRSLYSDPNYIAEASVLGYDYTGQQAPVIVPSTNDLTLQIPNRTSPTAPLRRGNTPPKSATPPIGAPSISGLLGGLSAGVVKGGSRYSEQDLATMAGIDEFGTSSEPVSGVDLYANQTPPPPPETQLDMSQYKSLVSTQGTTTSRGKVPFTFGDGLQTVSALSKFAQLAGGAEKERTYVNESPITKQTYDPTNALFQNQRAFRTASDSVSNANSLNVQRALKSNLYSQNLGQQNNIQTQYEQLNQNAGTQYEERVAGRRRENIQYATYADNVNAANRGAYKNSVQNAFDSLGNLGQNFNQKRFASDAINLLGEAYKDVSPRFLKILGYDK